MISLENLKIGFISILFCVGSATRYEKSWATVISMVLFFQLSPTKEDNFRSLPSCRAMPSICERTHATLCKILCNIFPSFRPIESINAELLLTTCDRSSLKINLAFRYQLWSRQRDISTLQHRFELKQNGYSSRRCSTHFAALTHLWCGSNYLQVGTTLEKQSSCVQ